MMSYVAVLQAGKWEGSVPTILCGFPSPVAVSRPLPQEQFLELASE